MGEVLVGPRVQPPGDGRSAFAHQLRARRRALELTQVALARRAHCSPQTIKKLEQGLRGPSPGMVAALADALGLPADEAVRFAALASGGRPPIASTAGRAAPADVTTWTTFVGRDRDVARLGRAVDEVRLTCLHGPGGVGKSRLAGEFTRTYVGPVVWVALQDLDADASVAGRVAAHMGAPVAGDHHEAVASALARLGPGGLLVLDNCEHVVTQVASLVRALLVADLDVRVLLTSRIATSVVGERRLTLRGLPWTAPPGGVAPAVRLFLDRRGPVGVPSGAGVDVGGVARVCRSLDGLPLAVELAAAQLDLHSLATLQQLLDDATGLERLAGSPDDERQGTVARTVRWSFDLLDPDGRAALTALARCRGTFGLDVATALLGAVVDDPRDALRELLRSSLVSRVGDDPPTFRVLETVRATVTAIAGRDAPGVVAAVDRAHGAWFADLAERCAPLLWTARTAAALTTLEAHHDDLAAACDRAVRRGDAVLARRLVGALARYWDLRAHYAEGLVMAVATDELPRDGPASVVVDSLNGLATLAVLNGELEVGRTTLVDAASLARRSGLQEREAYALEWLGLVSSYAGGVEEADDFFRRSQEVATAAGSVVRTAWSLVFRSGHAEWSGRPAQARETLREFRSLPAELVDPESTSWMAAEAAGFALADGDVDTARREVDLARRGFAPLHAGWGMSVVALLAGMLAARDGDEDVAGRLLAVSELLVEKTQVTHHPLFASWQDQLAGQVDPLPVPRDQSVLDLLEQVDALVDRVVDA